MRFAKLLNEIVSQEELFPIIFAKVLNEFVSQKELFPISAESIFSNLFGICPIIPVGSYRELFIPPMGTPKLDPTGKHGPGASAKAHMGPIGVLCPC